MEIMKCKVCGSELAVTEGATTVECEECGSVQTVPQDMTEETRKNQVYDLAMRLQKRKLISSIEKSIRLFESISGWKDADAQLEISREKLKEETKDQVKNIKLSKILISLIAVVVVAAIYLLIQWVTVLSPASRYNKAHRRLNKARYDDAIVLFTELRDYKDSKTQVLECHYRAAADEEAAENYAAAAMRYSHAGDYKDAKERCATLWNDIVVRETISAGGSHTVGLKKDGTVVAAGNNDMGQCDVSDWTDIIAVSAGGNCTIGLKADGTLMATGDNSRGQCNVTRWKNVVAISTSGYHTVALKADGTVYAVGVYSNGECKVEGWRDIVAISAGANHTVGMKADGTIVATKYTGNQEYYQGQCDVDGWLDVVAVNTYAHHTLGLKADGTVVAVGLERYNRCDVDAWTDIVDVNTGDWHTVGLKADGTVVAVGTNAGGRCDVSDWTDIVAISAGGEHTVGLKADGTVVSTADESQYDLSGWTNIKTP